MSPKVCQSPMVLQIPQVPLRTIHRTMFPKCLSRSPRYPPDSPKVCQMSLKDYVPNNDPLWLASPPKVPSNVLLSMPRSPWLSEYQKVCQSTLKSIRCPTKSLSHSSKFYQKCLKDSKSLWRFLQGRSPSPNYLVQKFLKAPQNTSDVPNSSWNSNRFPRSPLDDHQIT